MRRLSYLLAAALIAAVNVAGYVAYQRLAGAQTEPAARPPPVVTARSPSPPVVDREVVDDVVDDVVDAGAGDLPTAPPRRERPIRRPRPTAAKPVPRPAKPVEPAPAPAVDRLTVIEENPYKRQN